MDVKDVRREYLEGGLSREQLDSSPFQQFDDWMAQTVKSGIKDPTAMTVATVDESGMPNQRIVLLKKYDESGFVFFTNYGSHKAKDLENNPKVCLHFPWHQMDRQVKIQGVARRLGIKESLAYFSSRPRESQLAAWASNQSTKITSRKFLMMQFESMKEKFNKGDIPLPSFWGGYIVEPQMVEFWQGGGKRLHDRFEYQLNSNSEWEINRLAP